MSALGQKAKYSLRADVFRFGSDNGHRSIASACPFGAKSGSAVAWPRLAAHQRAPVSLSAASNFIYFGKRGPGAALEDDGALAYRKQVQQTDAWPKARGRRAHPDLCAEQPGRILIAIRNTDGGRTSGPGSGAPSAFLGAACAFWLAASIP
jgi:hypothetical protein